MIQRIQSVYLGVVAVLGLAISSLVTYGTNAAGEVIALTDQLYIAIAIVLGGLLALISIFLFKNRKSQFMLNRLNMIVQLFLLGVFVGRSLKATGGSFEPEKAVGMFLPVISIVLLVLANRAIKKDEDLVKSVDRLR